MERGLLSEDIIIEGISAIEIKVSSHLLKSLGPPFCLFNGISDLERKESSEKKFSVLFCSVQTIGTDREWGHDSSPKQQDIISLRG